MNNRYRLPDFIIAGAMKAGTTSLHHILKHHKHVFLPEDEIFFFDLDDIQQHPDFFMDARGKWIFHDYERHYQDYLEWYSSFFESADDGQVIGDDSTTYMASRKAPQRIARLLPDVKLIFMLRDPVVRAYSHYWHLSELAVPSTALKAPCAALLALSCSEVTTKSSLNESCSTSRKNS